MHIALGLPRANMVGQQVLDGILRANRDLGWTFDPHLTGPVTRKQLGQPGAVQGAISLVPDSATLRLISRRRLPLVLVQACDRDLPQAIPDDVAMGRQAAEHFLRRGYSTCAIHPCVEARFATDRADGFAETLRRHGVQVHDGRIEAPEGYFDTAVLRRWLAGLPTHCALFTVLVGQGLQCMHLLGGLGRTVPGDIAVLSAEEDHDLAHMCRPALSTVHLNGAAIGTEAVRMLATLLKGRRLRRSIVRAPPLGVIPRGSCDSTACEDPQVLQAARYLRDHHDELECDVGAVVAHVDIGRRTLEQRFRAETGHTLHQELQRLRVEHAARLLRTGEAPLFDIALACGWSSASQLCRVFKRHYGQSPQRWRESMTG